MPHAHVVVRVPSEEIVLIRRVRDGRVYHVAPGVAVVTGETPGGAAARAAREELGLEVAIEEMLHAQVFAGVDHFFFLATAAAGPDDEALVPNHDDFELDTELGGSYEIVRLSVRTLLGYDVRPRELAQRLVRRMHEV
jgi:ADP-ribose pyrophosphatase YjhB (NUDIX family)